MIKHSREVHLGLSTCRKTVITLTQGRRRACAKHNGLKSKVTKSVRNRPIRLSRERPDHERWVRFGAIVSGARGQTTSKHVRNRGSRSSRNKGRIRVSCSGGRASRDQREHRDRSCRRSAFLRGRDDASRSRQHTGNQCVPAVRSDECPPPVSCEVHVGPAV